MCKYSPDNHCCQINSILNNDLSYGYFIRAKYIKTVNAGSIWAQHKYVIQYQFYK